MVRSRRQLVDELSNSLAVGLRLRLGAVPVVQHIDLVLRRRIEGQRESLRAALERLVARKRRNFAASQVRFAALDLRARVTRLRAQFERSSADLEVRIDRLLVARRRKLESAMMQLDERSPLNILKRGFAIAYDSSGKALRSADQVSIGDDITVRLERGELGAIVRTKKNT